MNYFFRKTLFFGALLLLTLFAVFADSYSLFEKPKNFINFFVANSASSLWGFSGRVGGVLSFLMRLDDIYYEISDLKSQNLTLLSENVHLKNLFEKGNFLASVADMEKNSKWDLQPAKIIGVDTQNFLGFLLIDAGHSDDIEPGIAVITKDKFLIGKISEVNKNFSKIITIFHQDSKIAVMTQDSHVFGALIGDYIGNLKMDMIDKEKIISEGELVITSGRDGVFPEGLIIGEVQNIESKPENLFQTATVRGVLNIYDLDKILIVRDF